MQRYIKRREVQNEGLNKIHNGTSLPHVKLMLTYVYCYDQLVLLFSIFSSYKYSAGANNLLLIYSLQKLVVILQYSNDIITCIISCRRICYHG